MVATHFRGDDARREVVSTDPAVPEKGASDVPEKEIPKEMLICNNLFLPDARNFDLC